MANEDRQSEQFIREVDEELRRAQLKAIWDRFAPLIIGACVLVVLITAGYRGWLWWQERQASQAGDRYLSALELAETGDAAGSDAALRSIAEDGGTGYAVLARLRLAGEQAASGAKAEAITAFDQIAADGTVSESLRSLARIRAALLALDTGNLDGARERAEPLNVSGSVWRHPAREVLGTAAYHAGDLEVARGYFAQIQEDAETPPELWIRASWMVALIDGKSPAADAPEASAPAPDATPSDQAAPEAPAVPPEAGTPTQLPLSEGELPSGEMQAPSGDDPVAPMEPMVPTPAPVAQPEADAAPSAEPAPASETAPAPPAAEAVTPEPQPASTPSGPEATPQPSPPAPSSPAPASPAPAAPTPAAPTTLMPSPSPPPAITPAPLAQPASPSAPTGEPIPIPPQ